MFTTILNDTINLADVSRISRKADRIEVYFISRKDPETYYFETKEDAENADIVIMNDMKALNIMVNKNPA